MIDQPLAAIEKTKLEHVAKKEISECGDRKGDTVVDTLLDQSLGRGLPGGSAPHVLDVEVQDI